MVAWELTEDTDQLDPPTRESIDRERAKQFEAIQALQRMLDEVVVLSR